MAKELFFLTLLCTLAYNATPVFAAHEPTPPENTTLRTNECDAPPPDNFGVSSMGSGLVHLTWTPAWTGALHTLILSVQEDAGAWTAMASYLEVPGDSCTLSVSAPGTYKVTIATNCADGQISYKQSEVRFKIIELATAGRIPVNPVPVTSCDAGINMNHNWVGFRITKIGTGISNLFEINLAGFVKRVYSPNQIVAVNDFGVWPTNPLFPLDTDSPFRIDDLNNGNTVNVGFINFYQSSATSVVVCIDDDNAIVSWKPAYSFTALIAESTIIIPPPGGGTGQGFGAGSVSDKFTVENPFSSHLNLFCPQTIVEGEKPTINLLDTQGKSIFRRTLDLQSPQISFPMDWLLPGIYFLQIETEKGIQVLKVNKSL